MTRLKSKVFERLIFEIQYNVRLCKIQIIWSNASRVANFTRNATDTARAPDTGLNVQFLINQWTRHSVFCSCRKYFVPRDAVDATAHWCPLEIRRSVNCWKYNFHEITGIDIPATIGRGTMQSARRIYAMLVRIYSPLNVDAPGRHNGERQRNARNEFRQTLLDTSALVRLRKILITLSNHNSTFKSSAEIFSNPYHYTVDAYVNSNSSESE